MAIEQDNNELIDESDKQPRGNDADANVVDEDDAAILRRWKTDFAEYFVSQGYDLELGNELAEEVAADNEVAILEGDLDPNHAAQDVIDTF